MSEASTLNKPLASAKLGSSAAPMISEQNQFDEEFYLKRYPDVAEGIQKRYFKSGWHHYSVAGRREGREAKSLGFDEAFYLRSYPLARKEIEDGAASSPSDHFGKLGKFRGYLADAKAQRIENPAAAMSRFGGLWPDLPNAEDIINGKLEIGQITEIEAERLRFWRKHGYVIFQNAIAPELVDAAAEALDMAFSGGLPNQVFECGHLTKSRTPIKWQAEVNDHPAKALDIHYQSGAIRNAMFADVISDFIALVFESCAMVSQTLGFWRGSAQTGHQDTAYVAYTLPRNFVASWIALEDVTLGAGELFYNEGSHQLEDYLYGGRFKTIHDFRRLNGDTFPSEEVNAFVESLRLRTQQQGMEKKVFAAKKGDVLIWHADLVHGGSPVSRDTTRKSVVSHYCPTRLVPLYFENRRVEVYSHGKHRFASGVYLHSQPADWPGE